MKIFDQIAMCLQNLSRRKVRTFLTTMGVVIGTCAIVVMISLGVGLQTSQEAMLAQMGDLTKIEIYNYNSGDPNIPSLDDSIISQIAGFDHVDVITPMVEAEWGKITMTCGDYVYNSSFFGVYPEALEKLGYTLKEGSFPTGKEDEITVLFGEYAPYSFYDPNDYNVWFNPYDGSDPPVNIFEDEFIIKAQEQMPEEGKKSEAREHKMQASGLLVGDWNRGYETVYGIFMSIDQLYSLYKEYDELNNIPASSSSAFNPQKINYQRVYVKVTDMKYVDAVETKIKDLGYETYSMETIRKPMQEQAQQIMLILGSLGGISLLVAAMALRTRW